jgi:hypothetical protein
MFGTFDHIIEAMAVKHGINPQWGCCRPGIIRVNGERVCQHDWEFLQGNSVVKFSQAEVDAALSEAFPPVEAVAQSQDPLVAPAPPVAPEEPAPVQPKKRKA